jgi:hypothetical protein
MPRQLRLEYPGAVYHVVNRGDRREEIFRDDPDRERFLAVLRSSPLQHGANRRQQLFGSKRFLEESIQTQSGKSVLGFVRTEAAH